MIRRILLSAVLAALAAPRAEAGGFNIYEMGARATALGGAYTATADDPSAIFYNPAGLAWLRRGATLSLNVSPLVPDAEYQLAGGLTAQAFPGVTSGETETNVFLPTGAYFTYGATDRWTLGLGFFTPFGLGVEWKDPDTFPGRPLSIDANIAGFYLSPVVTFQPAEGLALSGGVNLVISHLNLKRIQTQQFGTNAQTFNVIDVELDGTSEVSASPALALMVRPNDLFSFGINFKGGVTNRFRDEDATLRQRATGQPALDAAVAAQLAALGGGDQKVSGDLDYPSFVAVGARVQPAERLGVMVDFVWFDWSAFDKVDLNFSNPALNATLEERYQDRVQWRFGVEYTASPRWTVMGGFVHDSSPQPRGSMSPILPDADRFDYSLGVTYDAGRFDVTAGYMWVNFEERSTVLDGQGFQFDGFDASYESQAFIGSIGLTYEF